MGGISKKIKIARANAGLTLEDLANKSGVSISTISKLERGKRNPSVKTIGSLAKALEIPIEKFII